jgi:hypothetical protein
MLLALDALAQRQLAAFLMCNRLLVSLSSCARIITSSE